MNINFLAAYYRYFIEFEKDKVPLFKVDLGTLSTTSYSNYYTYLGYFKFIKLSKKKYVDLKGGLGFGFSPSYDDATITGNSFSALKLKLELAFHHFIRIRKNYKLFYRTLCFVNYTKKSIDLQWGDLAGKVKITEKNLGLQVSTGYDF